MSLILDQKVIEKVCSNINSRNESIVFTHGSFDLLHVGHMEFLKRSKALGKYLFVGVDSDERVYTYKGVKRPIIPIKYRMELLLNLKFVDAVFCLEGKDMTENYYANLYNNVNPDVLTYGRLFMFKEQVKSQVTMQSKFQPFKKIIKLQKISHPYDNLISTTDIIDKILKVNTISKT